MLEQHLIRRTRRVPVPEGPSGDGGAVSRQFDAALLSVGFKASRELLERLGALRPETVRAIADSALEAVRDLVGDDARHNVYFREFPQGVPDSVDFWVELMSKALVVEVGEHGLNLLSLPGYGKYQHTYEEMLAAHEEFLPALGDRVTMLHLGGSLNDEAAAVYRDLAASPTPLGGDDLELLALLAERCADGEQPETIPVRENKAVINSMRFAHGKSVLIDTVTDVLRLAAALSGGDVTLEERTRFVSLARRDRRTLLAALDAVAANPTKLADVPQRREVWKRLGERLHPHEFADRYPNAAAVFAVARGEKSAPSLASRIEARFAERDRIGAVELMAKAPGILVRNVDRAARQMPAGELGVLREAVADAVPHASGRVLLSLREHLANRTATPSSVAKRIFVGRTARAWVAPDLRDALPADFVADLTRILDREIAGRMPAPRHLVVDPSVCRAAIALSGKTTATGYGIMPRGSRTEVVGGHLRFFIHWTQSERVTDFDLSVLLLDEEFRPAGQISFTNLSDTGAAHSGDITDAPAPDGGSEFIDIDLAKVECAYIVPQINIYSGESFEQVAESLFGYMTLDEEQLGKPFEPRTVRMKAEVRGSGRVVLPVLFARRGRSWEAVWTNLFSTGSGFGNRVEANRFSTALLARTIVEREYLTLWYLVEAISARAERVSTWQEGAAYDEPVTFVGFERPENLPAGSEVYGLDRWNLLVPA